MTDHLPIRVQITYDDGEESIVEPVTDDDIILVMGPKMELAHQVAYRNGTIVLTIKERTG